MESLYIPRSFDPFADAATADHQEELPSSAAPAAGEQYVHVRVQQRKGKKSLTTVQGLEKEVGLEKLLKSFKKQLCCNGNVVADKEQGRVLQLQGDHRKSVSQFIIAAGIVKKEMVKIHGF